MRVKANVIQMDDGSFDVITGRGHRVGPRLLSVSPAKGSAYPETPTQIQGKLGCFTDRSAAYASCMHWNLYLLFAWNHRSKSKNRSKE